MRLINRERLTLAKKVVTLDLDSAAIRLLLTRGHQVIRWASTPLTPGLIEDGVASDPKALGQEVKELMKSSGIRGRRLITSVSGLYSVSRILTLPTLPEEAAEEESLVLAEARLLMPFSAEEHYFSWWALPSAEREQQVLAIGMPRDLVDAQAQALTAAGLKPQAMELKALALVRAVNREQALVVNVEPGSVDVAVVVEDCPQIMRTVAQRDDLSPEDRARQVRDILEHTVGFYNHQHRDSPLESTTPLFLTGPLAEDIRELVEAEVLYAIEPLRTPLQCPPDLPISEYAVNIGLALREVW